MLHFVVDRGILMTFGSGMHGSLGHGNFNDVIKAKIVEALIGSEVRQVRTHLARGEINSWADPGAGGIGWLATPPFSSFFFCF